MSKKEGNKDYYEKYKTKHRGKGAKIDLISKEEIKFAYYIIARKIMTHFAKNECTLDAISVAEHYCKGEVLN